MSSIIQIVGIDIGSSSCGYAVLLVKQNKLEFQFKWNSFKHTFTGTDDFKNRVGLADWVYCELDSDLRKYNYCEKLIICENVTFQFSSRVAYTIGGMNDLIKSHLIGIRNVLVVPPSIINSLVSRLGYPIRKRGIRKQVCKDILGTEILTKGKELEDNIDSLLYALVGYCVWAEMSNFQTVLHDVFYKDDRNKRGNLTGLLSNEKNWLNKPTLGVKFDPIVKSYLKVLL